MTKTIEERAKEWGEYITERTSYDVVASKYSYIAGANAQKEIDEEVRLKKSDNMTEAEYDRETAFADWYLKNGKGTPTYSDAIEWARKQTIDEVCEWLDNYLACEHEILTKAGCEIIINILRKAIK